MSYEDTLKSITVPVDSSLGFYTGVPGLPGSLDPNYGKMYRFVKIVADNKVGLSTVATDKIVGILQNKPQNDGMAGTVGIFGISNIMIAEAIVYGDKLAPDATGRAVKDDINGKWMAMSSSTVIGSIIPALKL